MTETLELYAIREAHEKALLDYWRALVDGDPTADFRHGEAEGLARAIGELEATDPLEVHVEAVASITARSDELRDLVGRAREAVVANLRR